uniref:Uncharacterized protein n=1 Tax=Utricularia reniformis TaxID=192314 RepID=A0A1Y0AZN3_9LAMI|nr:hypothetical protein AEK19_MT0317 [Utricularia reniformis]ART30591.1 hypothetical protein AEK19_MT0317 [Utricularia reniformis]
MELVPSPGDQPAFGLSINELVGIREKEVQSRKFYKIKVLLTSSSENPYDIRQQPTGRRDRGQNQDTVSDPTSNFHSILPQPRCLTHAIQMIIPGSSQKEGISTSNNNNIIRKMKKGISGMKPLSIDHERSAPGA